jgi:hypothetical protein
MKAVGEAAQLLVYKAAMAKDAVGFTQKSTYSVEAAKAKLFAAENRDAMLLLNAYSCTAATATSESMTLSV